MADPFVHLRVASGYSLRYGASHPSALVEAAAGAEMDTLALTDRDGLYGAVRFAKACLRTGVAPVIGVDFALGGSGRSGRRGGHGVPGGRDDPAGLFDPRSAPTGAGGLGRETSRATELNTTLSARITHVLPNGYLVLAGTKEIVINSERQVVTLRGIARVMDLSASNQIRSDRLANLEVHVQGKGLVNDAIRRPNFLYRFLLGLLPF